MTITIVGVHGIGNHQPGHAPSHVAAHLAAQWSTAITAGPIGVLPDHVSVTCAYYAHRLRPVGTQSAGDELDRLSPDAQELVNEWLDILDPAGQTPQGALTRNLRQRIAAFARHAGLNQRITETLISLFAAEVTRYLDPNANYRFLTCTEVAITIASANVASDTTIVIAHSLGSVVTYETLHAYPHLRVDHLITIGSPLAIPHSIYQRLIPRPQPRGYRPPNTRQWTNIADIGDIVAVPPRGIRSSFDGVDHDIETTIHWADFHRASTYLRTPELADTLHTSVPRRS